MSAIVVQIAPQDAPKFPHQRAGIYLWTNRDEETSYLSVEINQEKLSIVPLDDVTRATTDDAGVTALDMYAEEEIGVPVQEYGQVKIWGVHNEDAPDFFSLYFLLVGWQDGTPQLIYAPPIGGAKTTRKRSLTTSFSGIS